SVSANKVWSLPRPTLVPGCHLVPRWRTMMLPARTLSLPNFFTPRRLLSLSRPLRDEPPAFLCAMSNYFAFGVFLAAALAGAAFFAADLGAPAASSLLGAGLSVGVPAISLALCWSAVASAVSFARAAGDFPAPAFGVGSALGAASAFGAGASALVGAGF